MPADRPEVDDHAAARRLHRRHHRLGGEELVAEIDVHPLVPIGGRDVGDRVAIVVAGIVDQHVHAAQRFLHVGEHPRDRVEVGQVQPAEQRHMRRACAQPLDQRQRFGLGNVDEGDLRTLPYERLDQPRADPRSATGHDHAPTAQRGVDRPSVAHHRVGH